MIDDNNISCFVDDLGVTCWVDDLGNTLCCPGEATNPFTYRYVVFES
jgi:hypothetical protein